MINAKDLSQEAPTSPRVRTGGYALLSRMADKGRATIAGTAGEYHFDCPLDRMLFGFKGVGGGDVLELLRSGADDEAVAKWLDSHGDPKTREEIARWSDEVEAYFPDKDPEKREWFASVCEPLGLDPAENSLMDFLEADDRASFPAGS